MVNSSALTVQRDPGASPKSPHAAKALQLVEKRRSKSTSFNLNDPNTKSGLHPDVLAIRMKTIEKVRDMCVLFVPHGCRPRWSIVFPLFIIRMVVMNFS